MKSWLQQDKQRLTAQISQGKLPHAILISGVEGSGKSTLGQWLAQSLMCQQSQNMPSAQTLFDDSNSQLPCGCCKTCNLFQQQTHPDSLSLDVSGTSIGVDDIRTVSRFFEKTAQLGTNQVVLIHNAEYMTESAANALLKTLEEPTPHSFILLLVRDEQRLLPTIISRCRQVQLRPVVGQELLQELGQQSSDAFVNLSHLPELSSAEILLHYHEVKSYFLEYLCFNQQRMALLAKLMENEQSMRWLEKITVDLLRHQHAWFELELPESISAEQFSLFLLEKKQALWDVYQQITTYNKNRARLTQFSPELGLEKLLVDIQQACNN